MQPSVRQKLMSAKMTKHQRFFEQSFTEKGNIV